MSTDERGVTLVDLLMAVAVMALVSAATLPVVADALERERGALGAQWIAARVEETRFEALRRGVFVALRVELLAGDVAVQSFADGNGNGVLTREVESGVDPPLGPSDRLGVHLRDVSLRINQRVPDIGGSGWLESGSDPVRLGRSSLLSFGPTGSATAGTLYVAAPSGPQFAVRSTGSTGRVRVLAFDPGWGRWLP